MGSSITDLPSLLAPLSIATFTEAHLDRELVHVPGDPGKAATLYSYEALNRLLEQHRLPHPRLRLTRGGSEVDPRRYQDEKSNALRPEAVLKYLADGATLLVNTIEQTTPELLTFTTALETHFDCRVNINLYASWRRDAGFRVHYDYTDVFIVQIAGRKHWKVWRPTRESPVLGDPQDHTAPQAAPAWDGVLEAGSVLYLPRGWLHLVEPMDEPTVHLTVTVNRLTAMDLLRWWVEELRSAAPVRATLPLSASLADQRAFVDALRGAALATLGPEQLTRFAEHARERRASSPRGRFELPALPNAQDQAAPQSLSPDVLETLAAVLGGKRPA